MTDDLITWLRAQLDNDEQVARAATVGPWWHNPGKAWLGPEAFEQYDRSKGEEFVGYGDSPFSGCVAATGPASHAQSMADAAHITRYDPARMAAEVDAKRRILDEHQPIWRTVEWPHDQNGKGEAQACRRCQNAAYTEWHPKYGEAGVLPEGFITPYVLAPCTTLRLLALPYADRPGYRDEWRP